MMFRAYRYSGKGEAAPLTTFIGKRPGIFETFRLYNGKFFRLEEHMTRFEESAKTACVSLPRMKLFPKFIKNVVRKEKAQNALIRLSFYPPDEIVLFIGERRYSPELYQKGVCLQTSAVRRTLSQATFPEAKTSDYQNAVLASLEPRTEETYEWLFLDRNGYITEVRVGNLFLIKQNGAKPELITPPEPGILNGVTRRFVIECSLGIGLPVRETWVTRHDLFNAKEAFLTNTSWEILPLRQLDGRSIGEKIPGFWTTRLQRQFRKRVERECGIKKLSGH